MAPFGRRRMRNVTVNDGLGHVQTLQNESDGLQSHITTRHIGAKRRRRRRKTVVTPWLAVLALARVASAQSCLPLKGSTACPAFNASSVSTDESNIGLFPFLQNVTDAASFDREIQTYIGGSFIRERFQTLIGCSQYNVSDPSAYYARYTTSVLCNAVVQNSVSTCGLTGAAATPLCADTCALYAEGEQGISASSACGDEGPNAASQFRADLTNCALPARSLEGSCIPGEVNEPQNCGFASNTAGLCSYCAASSPNSTDSCCVFSNTEQRCQGVKLPIVAATGSATQSPTPLPTSTSPVPSGQGAAVKGGLSGGAIAGIVVGSVLGALLLIALLICACLILRRQKKSKSPSNSIFNQPGPVHQSRPMSAVHDGAESSPFMRQPDAVEALPGGRVARMAAIEGNKPDEKYAGMLGTPAESVYHASSEDETPRIHRTPIMGPPPRRKRSLNGLGASDESSPGDGISSPEGTGQSEQLAFFKDYYSQDEIHPGDLVSTLWAYQPRAQDEFELERGDMIKVVGIWDDGWATGLRVPMRADQWRDRNENQRDSATSAGHERRDSSSPETEGEGQVKAFPLVCVCLPTHWRRTVDGETEDNNEETSGSMHSR